MEQPQYNLLERQRVEVEYARLYEDWGLGLTTYSPLAWGILTGKYLDGVPEGSRATVPGFEWLRDRLVAPEANARVPALLAVAGELGCTAAQLAIAWCVANPHVSTVITGASRVEQVEENLRALDVLPLLTPEVMARSRRLLLTRAGDGSAAEPRQYRVGKLQAGEDLEGAGGAAKTRRASSHGVHMADTAAKRLLAR